MGRVEAWERVKQRTWGSGIRYIRLRRTLPVDKREWNHCDVYRNYRNSSSPQKQNAPSIISCKALFVYQDHNGIKSLYGTIHHDPRNDDHGLPLGRRQAY